jgi:hypothetical protein
MSHQLDEYRTPYQKRLASTFQILLSGLVPGIRSLLNQRDCGPTKIDINISLLNNNTQTLISGSFSNESLIESVRVLEYRTETFVRDVEEVYGQE